MFRSVNSEAKYPSVSLIKQGVENLTIFLDLD